MPDIYVAPKKGIQGYKDTRIQKEKKEERTTNPLAALALYPANVRFETQEREEKIILLLRKHWVTNLKWILLTFLMIFAPFSLRFFPILDFLPIRFQFITIIIWYLLILAFVFENFLSWFFRVYIVTDERIVDIDFYSLIYKEISSCKIDRIQDVTFKMGGVLRTLLNFGDVLIQTAGEVPVFEFEAVPRPAFVAKKINELIAQEEQEKLEGRVR